MAGTCKVVINIQYGGFSLSDAAILWMAEHGGLPIMVAEGYDPNDVTTGRYLFSGDYFRSMPLLVNCVETLGSDVASGSRGWEGKGSLHVYSWEADYGVEFKIEEYDGSESVTHPWQTPSWLQSPVWGD